MSASSVLFIVLPITIYLQMGNCLQCYECSSRLGSDNFIGCRYAKTWYLKKVECIGPSVCASYILTTITQGSPPSTIVNRGCQAIRYGSTCEDIFNDLRRRGPVFPGHHECSTCSTNYCNLSPKVSIPVLMILFISLYHLKLQL